MSMRHILWLDKIKKGIFFRAGRKAGFLENRTNFQENQAKGQAQGQLYQRSFAR